MADQRKPTREERLAAALRANLRKRKARETGAASDRTETGPDAAPDSGDGG